MPHYDLTAKLWVHRAKSILLWLAVAAVCAWVAWLTLTWLVASGRIPGLGSEPVAPVKVTQSPLAPESNLKVLVVPPRDRPDGREAMPLRLLIENDGASAGWFAATAANGEGCIGLDTRHSLSSAGGQVGNDGAIHLPAAAHATAELAIPVVSECGREHLPQSVALQLSYHWLDDSPKDAGHAGNAPLRSFPGTIATSPITFTSRQAEIRQIGLHIASELARDFTWPVLLAMLGILAQNEIARRGNREQIFNTLLPVFNGLEQAHYLPIARRMQIIVNEEKYIVPATFGSVTFDVAVQRTFCAILLMRRRMQHLFSTKGGVFFRSTVAEKLFSGCVSPFYQRFQEATKDRNQCEILAVSLDPASTLDQAIEKLFSFTCAPAATKLLTAFTAWAVDKNGQKTKAFEGYLKLNELALAVITFEINRVYYQTDQKGVRGGSNWYFDAPQLELVPAISEIINEEQENISLLLAEYLNGIPRECRQNVSYPS